MTDEHEALAVPSGAELTLTIGAGEPVSGTVIVKGHSEPLAFCGWIELMAVINDLRLRTSPAAGTPASG